MDKTPDMTLDPADPGGWEQLRRLGHRMVNDVIELHRQIRDDPAWRPMGETDRSRFTGTLPPDGEDLEATYRFFRSHILPFHLGNIHPRHWGWVNGTGTTVGALADLLAAAMNPNCAGADQSARYVEQQVLDTLKASFAWPRDGSGLLTSGGSVANLIGIAAARDAVWPDADSGALGLRRLNSQLVAYTSVMAHNSVDRAVRLLGIGTNHLRKLPIDSAGRMDLAALGAAVSADREAGFQPFCVVATAGTVDQGAVDPLTALADYSEGERLWLHVDGAFGAAAALSDEFRPLVRGMERAHSLAFDLHKWLQVPIEVGCVLVRDPAAHRRPFTAPAAYLAATPDGLAPMDHWMAEYGPQLTRGFRALKVWFTLRVFGMAKLGRLVARNIHQTRALEARIRAEPRLQLLASGPLNVLCFRYVGQGVAGARLNRLNRDLLVALQRSGIAVVSSTTVGEAFALRLAVTNHRTTWDDLALLVPAILDLGDRQACRPGITAMTEDDSRIDLAAR